MTATVTKKRGRKPKRANPAKGGGFWYGVERRVELNHMTIKRTLARKVKRLRLELGWSQDDLAWQAGLCLGTINRIEKCGGKKIPMGGTLLRLAMCFDVQIDWLLGRRVTEERMAEVLAL